LSIVNYFSGIPRREQVEVLQELERLWSSHSCFVIQVPVAGGKSRVAAAIASWAESFEKTVNILPPSSNELLQHQYEAEFPDFHSVWGASKYRCHTYHQPCSVTKRKRKGACKECPHQKAQVQATRGVRLMNPHTMLGTRKVLGYPQLLIVDEAHTLIGFQQQQGGYKLWRHQHQWPQDVATAADVVKWIEMSEPRTDRLAVRKMILRDPGNVMITKSLESYRNRSEYLLEVKPLTVSRAKPLLWPQSVKKLVLLSATIGRKDIEELGLDSYHRVAYIQSGSPIPPALRPVVFQPLVDMTHRNSELALPKLAGIINQLLARHPSDAGIIHTTYDQSVVLQRFLTSPRYMWHHRGNRTEQYNAFKSGAAGRGRVLVACGMHEGVDLAGDSARWQVITKMPAPSLGDPAIALKADADPEWYAWETVKQLLQACGRVCRTPSDYGITYIFDTQFERLYRSRLYMFPDYFRDSVKGLD
jgi:Rad3-related DNA helicase